MFIGEPAAVYLAVGKSDRNQPYDVLCNRYQGLCTQKWSDLIATDKPAIRFCDLCQETVLLVESEAELKQLRGTGQCVAYGGRAMLA